MKVDKRMMQLTFSVTCFKPLSLPLDSDAPGRKASFNGGQYKGTNIKRKIHILPQLAKTSHTTVSRLLFYSSYITPIESIQHLGTE